MERTKCVSAVVSLMFILLVSSSLQVVSGATTRQSLLNLLVRVGITRTDIVRRIRVLENYYVPAWKLIQGVRRIRRFQANNPSSIALPGDVIPDADSSISETIVPLFRPGGFKPGSIKPSTLLRTGLLLLL